ncbi:DUF222 domain-containing protein, partial [Microbispora sp. NPDC049633]|uniref:DUF222 domain-containing protein n=1 Tax=Microbispora sp. NPDC049633 TaxID=3154355 RepID=UPI0034469C64
MDLFDFDPPHPRRSNITDNGWWDRLVADSPLWSSEGSLARDDCGVGFVDGGHVGGSSMNDGPACGPVDGAPTDDQATSDGAGDSEAGAGRNRGRSSWVLVGSVRESAQALALAAVPDDVDICLAEAEELLFARDRITCALADRVGRVHRAGQAKRHGHASTRSWLRTAGGMSVAGAGRLLTLGVELARLPRVREMFAAGGLAAGVVEAICAAVSGLSDEQAGLAEPILVELAGRAGAAEVAKAGRYLRAVLDPDGEDRDERADYGRRFLRVRPGRGGGLEGEFYLPREHAARLQALLEAYARPRAEGDDRPLRVRQADAFMALLEEKIAAELLVLVNAESLPTDPAPEPDTDPAHKPDTGHPASTDQSAANSADRPETFGTPEAPEDTQATEDVQDSHGTGHTEGARNAQGAETPVVSRVSGGSRDGWGSWWGEWRSSDPPGDASAPYTHAGPRPAGEDRHGPGNAERPSGTRGAEPVASPGPEPGSPRRAEPVASPGSSPGAEPGASAGGLPGAGLGAAWGTVLGPLLGTAPGLLLATGQ